jgi:hypothetical protein
MLAGAQKPLFNHFKLSGQEKHRKIMQVKSVIL